jgi:hypothetical protein
MNARIKAIEDEIVRIKAELAKIREMRPGSLSTQKRRRGGRYYQLSYRHNGRGHTEYIRPELVPLVQRELQSHRRFRELVERWTSLAIELCKIEMEKFKTIGKDNGPKGE